MLRKLAGREVMETVRDPHPRRSRTNFSESQVLCWGRDGGQRGGPFQRTRQKLLEELTSWKGRGLKWHTQPCEAPGDLSWAHPVSSSVYPLLAQSPTFPQLQPPRELQISQPVALQSCTPNSRAPLASRAIDPRVSCTLFSRGGLPAPLTW